MRKVYLRIGCLEGHRGPNISCVGPREIDSMPWGHYDRIWVKNYDPDKRCFIIEALCAEVPGGSLLMLRQNRPILETNGIPYAPGASTCTTTFGRTRAAASYDPDTGQLVVQLPNQLRAVRRRPTRAVAASAPAPMLIRSAPGPSAPSVNEAVRQAVGAARALNHALDHCAGQVELVLRDGRVDLISLQSLL